MGFVPSKAFVVVHLEQDTLPAARDTVVRHEAVFVG